VSAPHERGEPRRLHPDRATSDMPCDEFVELVTGYLEGTLEPETVRRIEIHLPLCEGCTTYLDQMRHTISALADLSAEALPGVLRDALLKALRATRR
jgi:predicted anti-sigma-YlaC factor YlaD